MLLFVNVQCCPFAVVLLLLYFMPVYALCNFVKKGAIQIKFIIIIRALSCVNGTSSCVRLNLIQFKIQFKDLPKYTMNCVIAVEPPTQT